MKNPLFPKLPGEIKDLDDEQLQGALEAHKEIARKIRARDAELLGEIDAEDLVTQFQAATVEIKAMEAEQEARAAAEVETAAELDRLAAEALGEETEVKAESDDETGTETNEDDEAAVEVPASDEVLAEEAAREEPEAEQTEQVEEAVTASTEVVPTPRRRLRLPPATVERSMPEPEDETPGATKVRVLAASGIEGITEGMELDREQAAQAVIAKQRRAGSMPPGFREEVVVASMQYEYPPERMLTDDPEVNGRLIKAQVGRDALAASGGICATPVPIWDLPTFGVTDRPVRDALVGFGAPRGAITYPTPLSIADVTNAVGRVTAAQDEAGGSGATKTCQVLDCDPFQTCEIYAVYACVEWGNFGARTWPERVASFMDLVGVAHARLAEGYLLTAIDSQSTDVTAAEATYGYGAASNLLAEIIVAAAAQRSRHRMADSPQAIRVLLPAWAQDLITVDLINGQFDRFAVTRAQVPALLRSYGVEPTFYLDSAEGEGMIFGAQPGSGAALLTFPDTVTWYMFPEGTWLFLDGGTLDLGIVRDSVLNQTNDYQIFFENFENACMIGLESLKVTSSVCPNGATGGPTTLIDCTP